jgi:anti-sigma regulatory factor (Ser/Thr protein kinase)
MVSRRQNDSEVGQLERPRAGPHVDFFCECGDSLCAERLSLAPEAYERLPGPALAPGHEPRPSRCPDCGGQRRWYCEAGAVHGQLPAAPATVGEVRARLAQTLAEAEIEESRRSDALLLVSELVTNAIVHGSQPGDQLELVWRLERDRLAVAVRDCARRPAAPTALSPNEERPRGRGLRIVDQLAERWGERIVGGRREVSFQLQL